MMIDEAKSAEDTRRVTSAAMRCLSAEHLVADHGLLLHRIFAARSMKICPQQRSIKANYEQRPEELSSPTLIR
jgi:hypothetical protein